MLKRADSDIAKPLGLLPRLIGRQPLPDNVAVGLLHLAGSLSRAPEAVLVPAPAFLL
jgi:hypothetical protein